jgi:hypothetical protein
MKKMYAGRGFDRFEYVIVTDLENVSISDDMSVTSEN